MSALRLSSRATVAARSLRQAQLRHFAASLRSSTLTASEAPPYAQQRSHSSRIPAGRPSRVKRTPHVPAKPAAAAAAGAAPRAAPTAAPATQEGEAQQAAPAKDGSLQMPDELTRELTAPVKVPDDKGGVLQESTHGGVAQILSNSAVVVTRQVEMMNIFLGFEQANKYALLSPDGQPLGYLLEQEGSFGSAISRQMLRNHRPFNALVLSPDGTPLLRVHRALTWINSTTQIWALDPSVQASSGLPGEAAAQVNEAAQKLIGEVRQRWHPLRRRYEIFRSRDNGESMEQVAGVDGAFLTWDFNLQDENGQTIGAINRNFRGFAREIFADVGQYVVRFDAALEPPSEAFASNPESKELVPSRGLTLDERAVTLALAFSLDVDYFSRHSSGGGGPGMMPWLFFPGSGGGSAEPAPAPGTGQDSSGVQAPPDAVGGLGANPAADAGAMAGYDAWSSRRDDDDSSFPPAPPPEAGGGAEAGGVSDSWGWQGDSAPGGAPQETWGGYTGAGESPSQAEDVWGSQGADPWSEAASGAGEGGGGGFLSGLWDLLPNGD